MKDQDILFVGGPEDGNWWTVPAYQLRKPIKVLLTTEPPDSDVIHAMDYFPQMLGNRGGLNPFGFSCPIFTLVLYLADGIELTDKLADTILKRLVNLN